MTTSILHAGAASIRINGNIGDDLVGQLHRRIAVRIRDDLEANAIYLADGTDQVLLISLDLCGLFLTDWVRQSCQAIEAASGVPARNVITASSHTHTGPTTAQLLHDSPTNERYLTELREALCTLARQAKDAARPAEAAWASGHARIGYNRRLCWADGTHSMYGDATRPDFAGIEGPDDPQHNLLALFAEDDTLIALLHNNSCHATSVEGDDYYSADFPGEARRLLRETLRPDLPVLYLQGASGDISPWQMVPRARRYDGQQRLHEIGATLAAESLRLLRDAPRHSSPILRHAWQDLRLPVRTLTEAQLAAARAVEVAGEASSGRAHYVLQVDGALRLHHDFHDKPIDTLAIHVLRIGDFAIVTNPCELYCQFGLDIKRRSPAAVTAVTQLADGFSGYCPTLHAVHGGGYSADTTWWTRLTPDAGYRLVEASACLLHQQFTPTPRS